MSTARQSPQFGKMLTEAIRIIQGCEEKSVEIIQDELGYALGKKGGSSVERWRQGFLPPNLSELQLLAQEIIRRSCHRLDEKWLVVFLKSANHPSPEAFAKKNFPSPPPPKPDPPQFKLEPQEPSQFAVSQYSSKPEPPQLKLEPKSETPTIFQAVRDVTNFVGREALLAEVADFLRPGNKIGVLQGMAGVGKSALATRLAYLLKSDFPDGVLWSDLSNISEGGILNEEAVKSRLAAIAKAYGRDITNEPELSQRSSFVREILANKKALIILDSAFEEQDLKHFVSPSISQCAFLITSQNKSVSRLDKTVVFPLDVLREAESLSLLQQFVTSERVEAEKEAAQQIVTLLGGLPLAIKVVACGLADTPDIRLTDYYELLLEERLRLDNVPEFESTSKELYASLALSFDRLHKEYKPIFACLSVFAGPNFSVGAVASLLNTPLSKIQRAFGQLLQRALVESSGLPDIHKEVGTQTTTQNGELSRYRLHPLVKAFAEEKLRKSHLELSVLRQNAANYFATFTKEHSQKYNLLGLDWENIYDVLQWTQTNKMWDVLYQIVNNLTAIHLGVVGFLDAQGHWSEANALLQSMLQSPKASDSTAQAALLFKLAAFAFRRADFKAARHYAEQIQTFIEQISDDAANPFLQAYFWELQSQLKLRDGDKKAALICLDRGIAFLEGLASPEARHETGYLQIRRGTALARAGDMAGGQSATQTGVSLLPSQATPAQVSGFMNLGNFCDIQGDMSKALIHWEDGAKAAQTLGDSRRQAGLLQNMGTANATRGRLKEAITLEEQALALYEKIGDVSGAAFMHSNLGEDYLLLQDYETAQNYLDKAILLARQHQLGEVEVYAQVNQARWQLDQNQIEAAHQTLQQADALCQQLELEQQRAEVARLWAELAYYQNDYPTALERIDAALSLAQGPKEVGVAWRLKGDIWLALGETTPAETAYQTSQDTLGEHNCFELARTQLALGQYYQKQKGTAEAETVLKAALTTFELLQMTHYITATRQALGWRKETLVAAPLGDSQEQPVSGVDSHDLKRFIRREQIGVGGQGVVYLGEDQVTGQRVVIKSLRPDREKDTRLLQRLQREAEILRQLDHPNIVKLMAAGEVAGEYVLVMEYIPGGTLRQVLQKTPQLPLPRVLEITLSLAHALAQAHELNIIHRDLKPENVLLAADGTPRLTDFGIGRMMQRETRLTETGDFLGSLPYMPPEAFERKERDARSDIWALGVMLYEMLSGKLPFTGTDSEVMRSIVMNQPPDLIPLNLNIPLMLVDLVERMLNKNQEDRLRFMNQVIADLEVIYQNI